MGCLRCWGVGGGREGRGGFYGWARMGGDVVEGWAGKRVWGTWARGGWSCRCVDVVDGVNFGLLEMRRAAYGATTAFVSAESTSWRFVSVQADRDMELSVLTFFVTFLAFLALLALTAAVSAFSISRIC